MFLLERYAINLVNAHISADEIPVFLVSKRTLALRPGKRPRSIRMIWIVNKVLVGVGGAPGLLCINQHSVINP